MVHCAPDNKLQPSNPLSVFQILRSKPAARPVVSTTWLRRGTALCNSIQAVPRERRVSEWSCGVPRPALMALEALSCSKMDGAAFPAPHFDRQWGMAVRGESSSSRPTTLRSSRFAVESNTTVCGMHATRRDCNERRTFPLKQICRMHGHCPCLAVRGVRPLRRRIASRKGRASEAYLSTLVAFCTHRRKCRRPLR
jgi:hypothetical protein